jgi:hypothetical protein
LFLAYNHVTEPVAVLARRFVEEKMTWMHDVLWERFIIAGLACTQVGVLGALAVVILPLVSEALQIRSTRKAHRRMDMLSNPFRGCRAYGKLTYVAFEME